MLSLQTDSPMGGQVGKRHVTPGGNVAAGSAIPCGLGQGATMVAALWGVFICKEFKSAPAGTNKLLTLMFIFYVIGLGFIIIARVT